MGAFAAADGQCAQGPQVLVIMRVLLVKTIAVRILMSEDFHYQFKFY